MMPTLNHLTFGKAQTIEFEMCLSYRSHSHIKYKGQAYIYAMKSLTHSYLHINMKTYLLKQKQLLYTNALREKPEKHLVP